MAKIRADGIALGWIGRRNYTLSCAFQTDMRGTWLRFWDAAWDDDEPSRTRKLWGPLLRDLYLTANIATLRATPDPRIEDAIDQLHRDLVDLANTEQPAIVPLL